MREISEDQKAALKRAESHLPSPNKTFVDMYGFLVDRKPKDEPIDARWAHIWALIRKGATRYFPEQYLKEMDTVLESARIVDPEISKLVVQGKRVTFLLGAGASAPSGIPTVDKLLSELWKRARKIGREDLDRLAEWCAGRKIANIEDLLTAAYISDFAATNQNITSLLDYFLFSRPGVSSEEEEPLARRSPAARTSEIDVSTIKFLQDTLQTLFGLLANTMISASPNPIHEAIVEFIKKHKETSVITTNYDGCMDEAILKNGLPLRGTIGSESHHTTSNAVDLIKMHGSINWAYCDSCQVVREFDLLELKNTYEEDKLSYPVIGICKKCGGLRRPLLVPPLSFKFLMFPNLIDIWNSARQSIENADFLMVVGYSFSEADTYITKIVSRSMSMNKNQQIIIVDTNPKLAPALRERFSLQIEGFDKKRILSACESGDKILPGLLESMVGKKPSKAKSPTKKKVRVRRTRK